MAKKSTSAKTTKSKAPAFKAGPAKAKGGAPTLEETLAQLIGSTRQRVNQILKEWELAGTVEQQYGHLTLLDRALLEKLAIL